MVRRLLLLAALVATHGSVSALSMHRRASIVVDQSVARSQSQQPSRRAVLSAAGLACLTAARPGTVVASEAAAVAKAEAEDDDDDDDDEEEEAYLARAIVFVDNALGLARADPPLAALLLRLAFHDAATRDPTARPRARGGVNGSIRLPAEVRELVDSHLVVSQDAWVFPNGESKPSFLSLVRRSARLNSQTFARRLIRGNSAALSLSRRGMSCIRAKWRVTPEDGSVVDQPLSARITTPR